jgi:hypothetical protein
MNGQRKLLGEHLRCMVRNTTIPTIKQYLKDHPDQLADVLDVEEHGKRRASLINWCWDKIIQQRRANETESLT